MPRASIYLTQKIADEIARRTRPGESASETVRRIVERYVEVCRRGATWRIADTDLASLATLDDLDPVTVSAVVRDRLGDGLAADIEGMSYVERLSLCDTAERTPRP